MRWRVGEQRPRGSKGQLFKRILRLFRPYRAAALVLMFSIQLQLALFALVILPIWVIPTIKVEQVQRRLIREWHEESANMSAHLEETLSVSGSMLVKTFGRQHHETARFERSNA